jgi:phosphate transport system substrate-binding protein
MQPLVQRWEAAYEREHPGVRFANAFHGAAAVPAGLYDGVADIAVMGREWWPVDNMAFHWVYRYAPFGVEVVATAATAPRPSYTPVVIVNRANPLREISMAQLDAVFGCQHKAAAANVRVWGELGMVGPMAAKKIEPVGFGEDDPLGVFFRKQVLKGDYKPNPASVLIQGAHSDEEIAERVATDVNAIGYTSGMAAERVHGVKAIPVSDGQSAAVSASAESIAQGTYPLARGLSVYVNRKPEERLAKNLEGFVLFVLSDAGQRELRADEGWIALPADERRRESERISGEWTTAQATKGWKE